MSFTPFPGGAQPPAQQRTRPRKPTITLGRATTRKEGMRIRLTRIPGLTHPHLLKHPLYFQCPPVDEIERAKGHNSTPYTTYRKGAQGGEFTALGGRKLRRLAFSSLFVEGRPQFAVAANQRRNENLNLEMNRLVRILERLSESATPFRILATHEYGEDPWANMMAHLSDISVKEREPGALYVEGLVFEEWRSGIAGSRRHRAGGTSWPKTHRLGRDDTLYSLAKKYYGRAGVGREGAILIASRNDIRRWGFDTPIVESKRYRVGDKITIPAPPWLAETANEAASMDALAEAVSAEQGLGT